MRRDQTDRDSKGKVKFRYMEFEMDAGDPTLQDTIRNIVSAIGKGGSHGRLHDANKQPLPPAGEVANASTTDSDTSTDEDQNGAGEPESPVSAVRRTKRAVPRSPKILDELNLQDVKESLKELYRSEKPLRRQSKIFGNCGVAQRKPWTR